MGRFRISRRTFPTGLTAATRPTMLLDNDSEVVNDPEGLTRTMLESVLTSV